MTLPAHLNYCNKINIYDNCDYIIMPVTRSPIPPPPAIPIYRPLVTPHGLPYTTPLYTPPNPACVSCHIHNNNLNIR